MAHLGAPDMRHAIGYALTWPDRTTLPVARLDLAAVGTLHFAAPDPRRCPALQLARRVMAAGGHAGAAFNAAKEAALDQFIAGGIGFLAMAEVVAEVVAATLDRVTAENGLGNAPVSLDTVAEMDHLARIRAAEVIASGAWAL